MIDLETTPEGRIAAKNIFQKDAKLFFTKVLGVEHLEAYQKNCIDTVWAHERTAIKACHDLGKTFLMARISMAFLNCFPNSKVITTAPTYNQVEKILWSEIRAAHKKALFPLGGKLNLTNWEFSPDWFAIGFTPRNEVSNGEGQGTQSSFQGFHAEHLLVVFDEATGIPTNIWNMAEGLLTSANVKFVAIGNPTSKSSEFFRCFRDRGWKKISLTCFDSPNLIANGILTEEDVEAEINKVKAMSDEDAEKYLTSYKVVRPYLLTTKWVIEKAAKWGMTHPLTVSKIFGKFPESGDNTLLPLGYIEEAQMRVVWPVPTDRNIIGIDVARFGSDATTLTGMKGKKQLSRKEFHKHDTIQVVGEAIAHGRELFPEKGFPDIFVVDETGLGAGVVDLLRDTVPDWVEVRGVQFGAAVECDGPESCKHKDCEKAKFSNLKARMFGLLQQDLKSENGIQLLPEDIYLDEGPTIIYRYDKAGRMVIESKDDYKKRTGRGSPDNMDSLALANYGNYDVLTHGSFSTIKKLTTDIKKPNASGLRSGEKKW